MNSLDHCLIPVSRIQHHPPTSTVIQRPKRGNIVNASPHRPLVPAKQCLSHWSTPNSLCQQTIIESLFSCESHQRLLDVALASLAPDTCSTYAAGLLRFSQFCDNYDIDEDLQMPASSNLLSMFLAESAAGSVSLDCANNWLAEIHFWHNLHGAPCTVPPTKYTASQKASRNLHQQVVNVPLTLLSPCFTCMHCVMPFLPATQRMLPCLHLPRQLSGAPVV
jgi:hypothetical protein